jgi:hypothetical protein
MTRAFNLIESQLGWLLGSLLVQQDIMQDIRVTRQVLGVLPYLLRTDCADLTLSHSVPFSPGFKILNVDKSARSYDNTTYTFGNAT